MMPAPGGDEVPAQLGERDAGADHARLAEQPSDVAARAIALPLHRARDGEPDELGAAAFAATLQFH